MLMRLVVTAWLALLVVACEPTNQGYEPEQPIAYSHAVHAGAMQIPCQYCHFAAERGRYAGIPPAQVCMNCHTQVLKDNPEILKVKAAIDEGRPIEWVRIHQLPDYAWFNHSAHVTAGVACQSCHGPVQQMGRVQQWAPLTMGWCVGCHRTGVAENGQDTVEAIDPARLPARLTDCGTCHH